MTADVAAAPRRVPHATLADLAGLLRDQQARKLDIVAPAAAIRARGGSLLVDGSVPVLREDGVTLSAGEYRPAEVCDGGLAARLGIPAGYLRRLRGEHPGLYDANVNGWLGRDGRSFLLRCLRPSGGPGPGAVRAFLSDGYKIIDNLDVLMAALEGVRAAGYPVRAGQCDLTGQRMYVRVTCEQVATLAPALLAGCRSPFTGASGAESPVVFSGFVITNSETGCGAFTLTPRLVVQVCENQLGCLAIPGQPAEQDPAGGGRVPGRGQVPGMHTQTVGQNRSGRLVFGTLAGRAAATPGRASGAPRTPMIGW
ncbi:MAG: hypothetical protein ACLP7J_30195 [Streptosporangiaceae bacterium]